MTSNPSQVTGSIGNCRLEDKKCPICNEEVESNSSRGSASPTVLTWKIEIRQVIYEVFGILNDPVCSREFQNGIPLCSRCIYSVGCLSSIQKQLKIIEKQYEELKSEVTTLVVKALSQEKNLNDNLMTAGHKLRMLILKSVRNEESRTRTSQHESHGNDFGDCTTESESDKSLSAPDNSTEHVISNPAKESKQIHETFSGRNPATTFNSSNAKPTTATTSVQSLTSMMTASCPKRPASSLVQVDNKSKTMRKEDHCKQNGLIPFLMELNETRVKFEDSEDRDPLSMDSFPIEGGCNNYFNDYPNIDEQSGRSSVQENGATTWMSPKHLLRDCYSSPLSFSCVSSNSRSQIPVHAVSVGETRDVIDGHTGTEMFEFNDLASGESSNPVSEPATENLSSVHVTVPQALKPADIYLLNEFILGNISDSEMAASDFVGATIQNDDSLDEVVVTSAQNLTSRGRNHEIIKATKHFELNDAELQKSSSGGYQCTRCDNSYTSKKTLANHIKIHEAGIGKECRLCKGLFLTNRKLANHMRSHTKEGKKSYPCDQDECSSAFTSQRQLLAHVKVHRKSLQCNQCGKWYKVATWLQKHIRRFHPGTNLI